MGKTASINYKKSGANQTKHNGQIRPKYIIGGEVICEPSWWEAERRKKEIIDEAIMAYEALFHQRFKAQSYEWSAVCNIKEDTTMEDLERLVAHINEKYGFQCYQIAIHRDEGHINEKGEKIINHHAHLEFITLDKNTGKSLFRGELQRPMALRKMQDEVAEILGMERGVSKRLNNTKRIEPRVWAYMKQKEAQELSKLSKEKDDTHNKNLNQILDTLDSALNIDTSNAKSTKEAFNRHIQTIKDHTQELNDTKAQLTKAKQELDEVKQESFTITKQSKEEYESTIEKHKKMLLALANENKALKTELENERESSKDKLTKAQVKAIIEQERKAWIAEQGHTKEEYAQLRALNKQSYTTIEELNAKIAELNANIKALKSHETHILDTLDKEKSTHEKKITSLKAELQSKESALLVRSEQIKDLIADLESKDKIIANLQKQNNDLKQNHSNLSHRYAKFQSNENFNTNIAQNTQNRFSQELEGKNDERPKMRELIEKYREQSDELLKQLESKSTRGVDFGNVSISKRR